MVAVSCDAEMVELLREIFGDDYEVTAPPHPASITAIDAGDPDVLLIGTSDGGLTPGEIVVLAAAHMRLREVPMIVLTPDPDVLQDAGRMSLFPRVSFVALPFDLDTIRSVLHSIARAAVVSRSTHRAGYRDRGFDVGTEHQASA
jgi:hypothetical protein